MIRCKICGKEKGDDFFIHDKYAKGGIRNVCLECNKKRAKMRRETIRKHLEELEKKLNDYVQIKSISIDMSTEEEPYNRIYAKPIEKQGDVLLCEFESANYDFEQNTLKEENQQLKDVISKICMELVDPDDNMSNGLAEYFNQDLLLKIHEVLK